MADQQERLRKLELSDQELRQSNAEFSNEVERLAGLLDASKRSLEDAERNQSALQEQVDVQESESEQLRILSAEREEQVTELRQTLLELRHQNAALQDEIIRISEQLGSTEEALRNLGIRYSQLEDQASAQAAQRQAVTGEVAVLENQISLLRQELDAETRDHEQQRQELQWRNEDLNLEVRNLRNEVSELNDILQQTSIDAKSQDVQIANLGSQLNSALAAKAAMERQLRQEVELEADELRRYRSEFLARLRNIVEGQEGVSIVGDRFVFSSEVLFRTSEAELSEAGKVEIRTVAQRILDLSRNIPQNTDWVLSVSGHTDDRQLLPGAPFASNWELSQARALSVVKFLIDEDDNRRNP